MARKQIVWWILFPVLIIPVLAACNASGMMGEVAAETTAQQVSEPALKPITARAAGPEVAQTAREVGTAGEPQANEPTRTVSLPVVLSDKDGEGPQTATATAAFFTPPPSVSPTASATFEGEITQTPSLTPSPQGQTETPTATATNGVVGTTTPTASATPQPSATATHTPQPGTTATPTATGQASTTPTPTQSSLHFTNCSSRTGGNATVAVPTDTVITGNFSFEMGDEIAVFTPDGTICAGVSVWTGTNIAVTAWGDDSQTPEQDGLKSGDTMKFRIWDDSAGVEYQVTSVSFSMGSGVYTVDSIHVISAITVSSS